MKTFVLNLYIWGEGSGARWAEMFRKATFSPKTKKNRCKRDVLDLRREQVKMKIINASSVVHTHTA